MRKPWGYEYLCYQNEGLAIWFLRIEHNHRTSLHCHPRKHTGLILLQGEVDVSFLRGKTRLIAPEKIHIFRGRFHSTAAISSTGACLLEIETPEDKHDLVRLEDGYGRENTGYEKAQSFVPKTSECIWIPEPGAVSPTIQVSECQLKHLSPSRKQELMDYKEDDFFVVTRGGLDTVAHDQLLWPGDVIDGNSLNRLLKPFDLIAGTTLLHVRAI